MEYKGIFDTHAHYDDEKFNEDRDTVLKNIFEHGVAILVKSFVIIMSMGVEDSFIFHQ